MGVAPGRVPAPQNGPTAVDRLAGAGCAHQAGRQWAEWYLLHGINGDQALLDGSKKSAKKGEQTGPSPVDRAKETALPLAGDDRAMPWGAVVTAANANDGGHTEALLASWTVPPPVPARPLEALDVRGLPTAQADGADANRPNRARAEAAGFRLLALSRGPRRHRVLAEFVKRWNAVTTFFAQFGRIGRRLDRSATCPIRHQFDLPSAGRDGVGQHSVGVPSASQPNQKPN